MSIEQRYVFLFRGDDEIIDGSTHEFRCASLDDATDRAHAAAKVWNASVHFLGFREGFRSTSRFLSFADESELPNHVKQNEKVIYVPSGRVHS